MDSDIHKKYAGVPNELILKNAKIISEMTKVTIRVPTLLSVNASNESFQKICLFAKTLNNVDTIHILPYHTYGENKYALLGLEYKMSSEKELSPDKIANLKSIVETYGFKCVIGG
jgi:pyruvate formate lyase activating enzyme